MEGKSARERLIAIQRRLVDETKTEIYESLGSPGAELQCYYEEYQRVFQSSHSPAPREELIAEVTAADIVHFGDYHTLRESQKAPLRILRRVLAEGRRVVIATEVVHLPHQATLDAFLAGDIAEEEFLRHIGYEENWGFSWRNYRLHFDFAREQGIPMVAVNSDPAVLKDSLSFRDSIAAMRIVEALSEFPGALIAVIFGDLHMAPSHIPGRVNELLAHRKVPPRTQVVVYQNSEKIYWDLALAAIEQKTDVVRLEERKYCLINSTPLVKFQSYLNWEMNQEELEESVGLEVEPDISSNVMTEQVMQLVIAICRFLELPVEGLDDFTVHTSRDLDFLDKLEASGRFTAAEIEEIRQQVERDESYYITRERILYLGNLSMDHAAEEGVARARALPWV
ncbi:MAG: ChaN family lipoprotein, partial [Planctomycetota bacterium]